MMLSVTFDSNTLENVIDPARSQASKFEEEYRTIRQALIDHRLRGYFSDTWITLEGIKKLNRAEILGSRHLASSWSSGKEDGKNRVSDDTQSAPIFTLTIGAKMKPHELPEKFQIAKNTALVLGLRALQGSPKLGDNFLVRDSGADFYALREPLPEFILCCDRAGKVEISIAKRNVETGLDVGRSRACNLGLAMLNREAPDLSSQRFWYEGLGLAKDKKERDKVAEAIAEWSDAEVIVRHIGYGIDLLCSLDAGKSAKTSILDESHREWLTQTYGVVFCDPAELVKRICGIKGGRLEL